MENLNEKLLNRLKNFNNIKPNHCQREATKIISKKLRRQDNFSIFRLFSQIKNIYLYGSFGVGKSVLIKALNNIYPNSVIFHFSDLIFFLQKYHSEDKELLKKLDLANHFSALVGSDSFPYRKPDPRALLDTIKLLNADVNSSLLIGDSKTDRDTALAAGVPIIMVKFGHGALNHSIESLEPDAIMNNFFELPDLAKKLIN